MDKKEILANASEGLKADEMGVLMHIKRHLSAIWARMRGIDRLLCANIALLLLVCAMFFTMFVKIPAKEAPAPQNAPVVRNIKKTDGVGYTLSERTKVLDMTNRAVRKNRPTIVVVSRTSVSASEIKKSAIKKPEVKKPAPATVVETRKVAPKPIVNTVTLPIREKAEDKPELAVNKKKIQGDIVIDGAGGNVGLGRMTEIKGDLYLQNLRTYTLPCGTRVNGNLFLRNVALLKFCGCFDVRGNIYVSSNSSFGPIPKDAMLGGQVIF